MFDIFGNFGLSEFWKLWGLLAGTAAVGCAALAVAWFAPFQWLRQGALHVAVIAFAFTAVFGWGASARDNLYQAQHQRELARLTKTVSEANTAMEQLRTANAAEIARLQKLVDDTPPNGRIAFGEETSKRVGAIK